MIVLDASALADWLLQTPRLGPSVGREMRRARFIHTLDFAWIEVLSVLRRKLHREELAEERARAALTLLDQTPIRRHRASPLAGRVWQLRGALSPYDAAYVALAETLSAPLLTTDARLARAGGHTAAIVDASQPG